MEVFGFQEDDTSYFYNKFEAFFGVVDDYGGFFEVWWWVIGKMDRFMYLLEIGWFFIKLYTDKLDNYYSYSCNFCL